MGDMQVSAEYVAYGIHLITSLSAGVSTAIISHSQGGPNVQWALRFWPSTRPATTSFIPLSPDFSGIELLGSDLHNFCIGDLCQAAIWQQSAGSEYYAAMHADTFEELVPTTAIWSESDGVVNPPEENAQLPGATSMSVQDLCPLRLVTHLQMPIDAAAYTLAMDALTHGGKGSVSRARASNPFACLEFTAPHMDFSVWASLKATWDAIVDGLLYVLCAFDASSGVLSLIIVNRTDSARRASVRSRLWMRTLCIRLLAVDEKGGVRFMRSRAHALTVTHPDIANI